MRPQSFRCVLAAQLKAINKPNSTEDSLLCKTRLTMRLRQMALNPRHLRIDHPEELKNSIALFLPKLRTH